MVGLFLLLIIVLGLMISILEKLGDIKGKPSINWIRINGFLLLAFLILGMAAVVWEFYYHTKLTVNAQTPASAQGLREALMGLPIKQPSGLAPSTLPLQSVGPVWM